MHLLHDAAVQHHLFDPKKNAPQKPAGRSIIAMLRSLAALFDDLDEVRDAFDHAAYRRSIF